MGRTLVVGDIHGAARALTQVLNLCSFDHAKDRLIVLGDVTDGWPEVREVIDILIGIPHKIVLLGNHDEWALRAMRTGHLALEWTSQGGQATIDSYGGLENVPRAHKDFLADAKPFHIENGRCFVHAGLSLDKEEHPLATSTETLLWDRNFWNCALLIHRMIGEDLALQAKMSPFDEVYVGHTQTPGIAPDMLPVRACNVWNLDQGAGWSGKLTIMDIDTKEFWQSDNVLDLYPGVKGRGRR